MCIDYPGQVVDRETERVLVDCAGRRTWASVLLFPDLAIGEWVYVAAGTVIERLDNAAAEQITHEIAIAKGRTP